MSDPFAFYNADDPARWGRSEMPEERSVTAEWLQRAAMPEGLFLELGCGHGALAELSPRYTGVDLSLVALAAARNVGRALARPDGLKPVLHWAARRICADIQHLPLRHESIAFVFSWAAMEHVPHPEQVLAEIERVLRPDGVALLAPAWHCRPWAAEGLEFLPFHELRPWQRVRKALIPLRNAIWWRVPLELARRLRREWRMRRAKTLPFDYRRLTPNLERYIGTDSDAFVSMDPHAAAAYFASRGWEVMSHPTRMARLRARHEPVVVRKPAR